MSNTQRISRATVIDMVAKNASNIEIAAAVGCSGSTVTKLRKSLGLEPASKSLGDWSEARIAMLRKWWELDGLTASQIAAKFGGVFSRNGVMGKIHRLDLKARPSPIDRSGKARKVDNNPRGMLQTRLSRAADADRKPQVGANTFFFAARPKQAQITADVQPRKVPAAPSVRVDSEPRVSDSGIFNARPPSVPAKPFDGNPVTLADIGPRACRYIVGNEGQGGDTLMCGAPGHPWCAEHRVRVSGFRPVAVAAE